MLWAVLQFAFCWGGGDTDGQVKPNQNREACSVFQCQLRDPGLNRKADTGRGGSVYLRSNWIITPRSTGPEFSHPNIQQMSLYLSSCVARLAPTLFMHSASANHFLIRESGFQTCSMPSAPDIGDNPMEALPAHLTRAQIHTLPCFQG